MDGTHSQSLRLASSRGWAAAAVVVAALIGGFYGALLAAQQGWGAGDPVCTAGPGPNPMPACEVPFEASGWALAASALAGGLLMSALALPAVRVVRRLNR